MPPTVGSGRADVAGHLPDGDLRPGSAGLASCSSASQENGAVQVTGSPGFRDVAPSSLFSMAVGPPHRGWGGRERRPADSRHPCTWHPTEGRESQGRARGAGVKWEGHRVREEEGEGRVTVGRGSAAGSAQPRPPGQGEGPVQRPPRRGWPATALRGSRACLRASSPERGCHGPREVRVPAAPETVRG